MRVLKGADEAQFLFEISGQELLVVDFEIDESISSPFEAVLTLASEEEVPPDGAIDQEALLTILSEEADRYLHGIVNTFVQTGYRTKNKGEIRFYLYKATVVPAIWRLSLEQDCRIFQEMTTQEIVEKILKEGGVTPDRFESRLQGSYPQREYCVQYRESDLDFISRLLEEEGIFYFFEHSQSKHLLVFGDGTPVYKPIEGNPEVKFHLGYSPTSAAEAQEEYIESFKISKNVRTGKVTLRDFNFKKPSLDLTAPETGEKYQKLESYDYPGIYEDEGRGKSLAKVRLEQSMVYEETADGNGVCPRLMPGFTFTLKDHHIDSFNREFLVVKLKHKGAQPQVLGEQTDTDASFSYQNGFFGIPSEIPMRPEQKTPKQFVRGPQTAIVVGPPGEEIYTDEHGRVKVQFHWDREGKKDEKSSCWIRVSQLWAGSGWGAMYIPRIDQEVIVDFLEGDPDQPIITGRVYDGTNTPPYPLPGEKNKSTIKSDSTIGGGGSNEIRFDDTKGSEEIYTHAQKDQNEVVENNMSTSVGKNQSINVGRNQSISAGSSRSISVGWNHQESVGLSQSISVGAIQSITVGGNQSETVGGGQSITVEKGERKIEVKKSDEEHKNKANFKHEVKGNYELDVKGNLTIDVKGIVTIKGALIKLNP
jgi:type VI secretion system secreted protein VgrG